jgi:hypothetical protein
MFSSSVNHAVTRTKRDFRNTDEPGSNASPTFGQESSQGDQKTQGATSPRATVTTRSPARMTSEAMEKILRSRNISIHGAHIFYIDIHGIMALASAYATDKITRKVFIDTLNLFVQHACATRNTRYALTPGHFVSLGIPEKDAERLPLKRTEPDTWLIAGLFNGVIEMDDFDQLRSPERRGEFWEKHFGNGPRHLEGHPSPPSENHAAISWETLSYIGESNSDNPNFAIKLACERIEKGGPRYDAKMHFALRVEAAARKGQLPSLMGPYYGREEREHAFRSVFHIVDPGYVGTTRAALDAFTFVEPVPMSPRPAVPPALHPSETKDRRARSSCVIA